MNACFFMVLSDKSAETRVRHANLDIARSEAKRLALANPGVKFFVLASLGHAVTPEPVTWNLHEDMSDEIPF